jgi:hypothetical protein
MLYKYRHKNKKDYFKCELNKIIKSFDKCLESIKCIENHIGGSENNNGGNNNNDRQYKITYYENKLNEINDTINLESII